jgi:alpha-beta hydrolase superfamily lysophospholipase
MQHRDIRFQGAGDLTLNAQIWKPDATARALVVILHGHGEHSGRYSHVAASLVSRGFAVAASDLRGHGHSEGPRGFVRDWEEYREDLTLLLGQIEPEFGALPLFLYGHSIGGTVAVDYAIRNPENIHGLVASAPSLGQPNIPAILFTISKVLSKIYPSFSMSTQLDPGTLSRDPEAVRAYQDDPLVHSLGTARMGTELTKTTEWIQANAGNLQLPLLVIHGSDDQLVNPADSRRFFGNVTFQDKTYLEFSGGYHEPHHDLEKERAIKEIGNWIEAHL